MPLRLAALLLLAGALAPAPAALAGGELAEEEGWEPLRLTLVQAGAEGGIRCQIHLAHWFEVSFGPAVPGTPAELPLLARAASGEVALLNGEGRRMRLERIDCGAEATPRERWTSLSIDALRRGGGTVTLECQGDGEGAGCRWHR